MINFYDKKGNFIFDMGYLEIHQGRNYSGAYMLPLAHDSSQQTILIFDQGSSNGTFEIFDLKDLKRPGRIFSNT